jgi:hypothetical protein
MVIEKGNIKGGVLYCFIDGQYKLPHDPYNVLPYEIPDGEIEYTVKYRKYIENVGITKTYDVRKTCYPLVKFERSR